MRSYENSGFNPYNDNYRSESRGSARNYYSDENDITKRRQRTAHGRDTYGGRVGGFGEGRDTQSTSGFGGTSTYGRSAGTSNRDNDRDAWDRTGDEVKSWFGDDDAERRRRMDDRRDNNSDNWGSNRGSSNTRYGSSSNYGNSNYGSGYGSSSRRDNDRDAWDRGSDEVKSWFGDDDAERRRRMDDRRDNNSDNWGSSRNYGGTNYGSGSSSNYGSASGSYGSSNRGSGSNYGGSNYGSSNYGSGSSGYGMGNTNRSSSNSWGSSDNDNWNNDRNSWNRDRDDDDRGFFDRAGDEVKSWFGDDEAERRRRMDEMRDREYDNDYNSSQRTRSSSGSRTYSGPPYSYGSSSRRDYEW